MSRVLTAAHGVSCGLPWGWRSCERCSCCCSVSPSPLPVSVHTELWARQGRELPWQLKWSLPSREGSSALDTMHWRWGSGKAVNCGEWMETTVASAVLQTDPRGASMIRKVQPEAMDLSDREAGSRGDFPCSQPQPALHCRAGPRCNYC